MPRVKGLLDYSRANFGESFTREQKGGSIKILTPPPPPARLPFLDGRVTLHAGSAFLNINSFFVRPVRIQRGQGEIIRGRESARLLAYISGKGVKTFFSYKRSLKICLEGDPRGTAFLPY